jgi:2-hydroxychromene-2-carboxylate isomerase
MSDKKIDYYFCLNSPWVYLAQHRLEKIAEGAGARIRYFPVDLREIMIRLLGEEDAPERSELHRKYGKREMQRWAEFYGLPLSERPKYYPVSQRRAACLTVACDRLGADTGKLVFALPQAVWAQDRNINDWRELEAIANECGLPGDVLVPAAQDPMVEDEFAQNTEDALKNNVFGIPSYVVNGELFWGQDRLDWVERLVAA